MYLHTCYTVQFTLQLKIVIRLGKHTTLCKFVFLAFEIFPELSEDSPCCLVFALDCLRLFRKNEI